MRKRVGLKDGSSNDWDTTTKMQWFDDFEEKEYYVSGCKPGNG